MNNNIGYKTSFFNFTKEKVITIPTIQRDYSYGTNTKETNKILNNLLDSFYFALKENKTLTLNFIYGYELNNKFIPLDGQQRLTTLFLLHFYAGLFVDNDNDLNAIKDVLKNFTYATREDTERFCIDLIENIELIQKSIKKETNLSINKLIEEQAFYLVNYRQDKSIQSMLFVLKKIEEKFKDNKDILQKLFHSDYINFYVLDFGPFSLSDDLYIKMNARGKKLTTFEIFKSQLLKYIDDNDLQNNILGDIDISYKFDVEYSEFIYKYLKIKHGNKLEDLSLIDKALSKFVLIILKIILFYYGLSKQSDINAEVSLNKEIIDRCFNKKQNYTNKKHPLLFFIEFFDLFKDYYTQDKVKSKDYYQKESLLSKDTFILNKIMNVDNIEPIKHIDHNMDIFYGCIIENEDITLKNTLYLFATYIIFKGFKDKIFTDADLFKLNKKIRHLRNIIENSSNEIRHKVMQALLFEIENILYKGLQDAFSNKASYEFNSFIVKEELTKEELANDIYDENNVWQKLWAFENHPLLKGNISLFTVDKYTKDNPNYAVNLSNLNDNLKLVEDRLQTFNSIFTFSNDENNIDESNIDRSNIDKNIRANLLKIYDYSQYINNEKFRIIGSIFRSWSLIFTSSSSRHNQHAIMHLLDKINSYSDSKNKTIIDIIRADGTFPKDSKFTFDNLSKTSWIYYVATYYEHLDIAYKHEPSYGYFYDDGLMSSVLQSTKYNDSNVAPFILNLALSQEFNSKDTYDKVVRADLDRHKGSCIHFYYEDEQLQSKIDFTLSINNKGWCFDFDIKKSDIQNNFEKDICLSLKKEDTLSLFKVIKKDDKFILEKDNAELLEFTEDNLNDAKALEIATDNDDKLYLYYKLSNSVLETSDYVEYMCNVLKNMFTNIQ